jgi:hypothetical protein
MAKGQHSNEGVATIEKRIMKSFLSFSLALTAFSITSHAIDLPITYTSEDKSIVFKHSEDLQFSPKPLKTHDKEILFKSETIKGYTAGVTVSAIHNGLNYYSYWQSNSVAQFIAILSHQNLGSSHDPSC